MKQEAVEEWRNEDVVKRIEYSIIKGVDKYVVDDVEEARQMTDVYPRPLNIIEGPLMSVSVIMLSSWIFIWDLKQLKVENYIKIILYTNQNLVSRKIRSKD